MTKKVYLNSFGNFRAIAIILIVTVHTIGASGLKNDSVLDAFFLNIILGSTSLFVFISGYMFHYVFYEKFSYGRFIKGKIKTVFIPYLVLGFLPILTWVFFRPNAYNGDYNFGFNGLLGEYLLPIVKYYSTGQFMTAYWYIPFAMLIFLLSPVFVLFIRFSLTNRMVIIFLFSGVSCFLHRSILNENIFQNALYFFPIYLIGISFSMHKESVLIFFKGKGFFLFTLVVLFSYIQVVTGNNGIYTKDALIITKIDIMFIQKILLCFLISLFLIKYESRKSLILTKISEMSFSIYFIHPFLLFAAYKVNFGFSKDEGSWLTLFLMVFMVISLCCFISVGVKFLLGARSRYFIGY
ncbi:acyltransferase family protein [Leucothrix arctica]|uniref:Acyltransferase n=1 Tax=Leucothrix arctica TaxID=1481894 RepID=A0A317CQN1_9GAMM|nr:acyltransferase [Leucothrix arctica]PWQ98710.1 acyltransferase [Leucothrix arctica]